MDFAQCNKVVSFYKVPGYIRKTYDRRYDVVALNCFNVAFYRYDLVALMQREFGSDGLISPRPERPFINGWPGCQMVFTYMYVGPGCHWMLLLICFFGTIITMFYDASLPKPIRYLANKFLINYFKLWQNITKLCLEFHPLMSPSIIISQGTDIILHSIPPTTTTTTTTKHPSY